MNENNILNSFGNNYLQVILFLYLPLAFTLMLTVFNYKQLLKKFDDYRAFLLYFTYFFFVFLVIPCLIVFLFAKVPVAFFQEIGFSLGKGKKGLIIIAVAIPISILAAFIGSKDPLMKRQYPFSKTACTSLRKFIIFETSYLILYYLPWEFIFRGLLFFTLVPTTGLIVALSLQTIISTLYHIGHPDSEIFASLGAGFIFGIIAYITGSFIYTVFIHAFIGISNDTFLYYRHYKQTG